MLVASPRPCSQQPLRNALFPFARRLQQHAEHNEPCTYLVKALTDCHKHTPCCIQIVRWQESCWKPQRGALTWFGGLGGCYAGSGLQQVLQRIAGCCWGCSSTCCPSCGSCSWRCLRHCSKSEFFKQRPQCATEQQRHWQGLMLARVLQKGHRCFEVTRTSRS